MLSQEENAWAVYTSAFLFLTIMLSLRVSKNLMLIPFLIYCMLVTIGMICLLASHLPYNASTVAWKSKSMIFSVLPAASILVLFGIMEAQLIFIRHMAVALHNRDHWGSIYLRDPEKSQGFERNLKKKKTSLRPWTYWTSLLLFAFYLIVCISCVVLQSTSDDAFYGVTICLTILSLLSCANAGLIWFSCHSFFSANHCRTIRKNRDDLMFLKYTPLLFSMHILGMMTLAWIYEYTLVSIPVWIVLESFLVYFPLVLILIMCFLTGKIQTMGRQYPIEVAQQRTYSYNTVKYMETVTRKLTEEEVNWKVSSPLPVAH